MAAEALVNKASRVYGIHVRREDVQVALRDAAFADWAAAHLTADTLLTPDELALYTALDKSGHVDKLAELHDLSEVQAVHEDDVKTAIDELKRSTDSISKQTETLRQQHDALDRLVKRSSGTDARQDFDLSRRRKAEADQARVVAEVEELSHGLGFRVTELEQQAKDAGSNLNQTVDGVLHSDDKLFSSLQKLGCELDQQGPEEAQTTERLNEICMRLIKTTVETVRTRLDTVFLDSLIAAEDSTAKPATADEVRALEEEVESLYSEILPVAQMSVEQQHLEPALRSVNAHSGQSIKRSAAAMIYTNACLDHLLDRVEKLHERLDTYKSHQAAAAALTTMAKAEIAVDAMPPKKTTAALPGSPIRNASPVRPRANTNRRSSGLPDDPPLETLLHSLAISLPAEDSRISQVNALATALRERTVKADDVARNAQESFEAGAIAHLEDAQLAVQLLRDSVLAESPFGEVKLVDGDIEGSVEVLEQEVSKVRGLLDGAQGRGDGKSDKREDFLRRWGS